MSQSTQGQHTADTLAAEPYLGPLISSFISNIGYTTAPVINDGIYWSALHRHAVNTGFPHLEGSHSFKCLKVGGNYAIACFPNHPLQVQVYVGIYTWIAIVIDDVACQSLEDFEHFHERFASGNPQPTILLEAWAGLIRSAFDHWDSMAANFIVAASLDFHNACVLEARSELRRLVRTKGGQSLAWYIRSKTGVADAYAYFTFPKTIYPDISCFLEAIPDLSAYLCLANDVLSFYKEEKAKEKENYVNYRAHYEGNDTRTVLREIIEQTQNAVQRMRVVVKGREPYEQALNDHILGYVAFHILSDRYRLSEIGLGESTPGVANSEVSQCSLIDCKK
ncbi:terpenoid synthase [Daldinia vernicosa]|uniref:terpenoid synthase n=1 Tax=Daldinia vernicosa TaxID=114800 RepID=UPI0020084CF4|nr:terpenoid synthase [Daldinia vernicosa]KAI0844291.1 terpenoid synthase [Daldinia vernicosa]